MRSSVPAQRQVFPDQPPLWEHLGTAERVPPDEQPFRQVFEDRIAWADVARAAKWNVIMARAAERRWPDAWAVIDGDVRAILDAEVRIPAVGPSERQRGVSG